ncbi:HNH endonuclease signature motif containing protein [Rhizobium sp. S163]|uniref:HNH endonuclease signature motif containing protein n=1 Tax=Rhizobium sp. S163 TaxID=3055039 RepID=UPI0025A97ECD|nr:HNH endonuclease signature motif containing protein [Rhizobium sp. S163]MDM9643887.1 HNH endonuclease signature motif containing protein [Rhizobium sp. S163]
MAELTFTDVSKLLKYEQETSKLFWLPRAPDLFNVGNRGSKVSADRWNDRYAGEEAFTALRHGYFVGHIFRRMYMAHRVIWLLHYGEWPSDQVDHINGVRTDNQLSNLRNVTNAENGRNAKRPHDNTSGTCGVYWNKQTRRWRAYIGFDGRPKHLGSFKDIEDAIAARAKANVEFGYSLRHGCD